VLYEMLTGQPPFTGRSAQAILARVITERPASPRALRDTVSVGLEAATLRALARLPADRFASAAEFSRAVSESSPAVASAQSATDRSAAPASVLRMPRERPALYRDVRTWISAAGIATAVFFGWRATRAPAQASGSPILATLLPGPGEEWNISGAELALSPNGRQLVIGSLVDGAQGPLLLRSLDTLSGVVLAGTVGAHDPFWSPDGKAIGFFAGGRLQVLDLASRALRNLCPALNPVGGTWTSKGEILYVPDPNSSVFAVPAAGGPCRVLTLRGDTLPRGRPFALPDGDHFLLTSRGLRTVDFGSVSAQTLARLDIPNTAEAAFAPPDFILASEGSSLGGGGQNFYAQRIDTRTGRLLSGPVLLFDRVGNPGGRPILSASSIGSLVVDGPGESVQAFVYVTPRRGTPRDSVAAPGWMFRYSHDGRQLAIGGVGLWLVDDRMVVTRQAVGSEVARSVLDNPIWSPGDTALVFGTGDALHGRYWLFNRRLGTTTNWFAAPAGRLPLSLDDWSPDGRWIVMDAPAGGAATHSEIWAYDTQHKTWVTVVAEPANVADARVSPDGRWIAYRSDIDGSDQVYLRPFMRPGNAVRASPRAGAVPRWRGDGRELFFSDATGAIVAVPIRDDGTPGPPTVALPSDARRLSPVLGISSYTFEPTPDGAGFAYRGRAGHGTGGVTLVLNWPQLLRGASTAR
jgi:serine/threonine-protein kinase